jgi:hypothetical protein
MEFGIWCEGPDQVAKAFVEYYKVLLGTEMNERIQVKPEIFNKGNMLSSEQGELLCKPFSKDEIKAVIFSIPGSKAPGPDGYNSSFFQMTREYRGIFSWKERLKARFKDWVYRL